MIIHRILDNKKAHFADFLIFLWVVISLALLFSANYIIFQNRYSQGAIKSSLDYNESFISYGQGERLYIVESFEKESDPLVVLFFHGNAGGIGRIVDVIAPRHNVVVPAYPGYHFSSGYSNEEAVYKTVDLSMDYLKKKGIKEEDIIIFGASLGGAAALYAANKYPNVKNVILVGAFDKMQSVCSDLYYIFCVFTGGIFNNIELADGANARIRQFHSVDDEIIDFDMGQNLFEHITGYDKRFYKIDGGHNDFDAIEIIEKSLGRN